MKALLKDLLFLCLFAFCSTLSFAQNLLVESQNNTSCAAPNGMVSASVDGQTLEYSFKWYAGFNTTAPLLSVGPAATNLAGGTYTVTATHNSTAEVLGPLSVNVLDELIMPVVTMEVLSQVTSCSVANGSLKAAVTGLATDYTFAWYQGAAPSGPVLSTSQTISQLAAGTYSVVVQHKISQCQSVGTATVQNQAIFSASVQVLANATSCTSSNGALRAIPSTGTASSYTYKWYAGSAAQGSVISTSQLLSNRPAGVYTVVIRHKVSLCQTIVSGTIGDQASGIIAVEVFKPLNSCAEPGILRVLTQNPVGNFTYAWYEGTTAGGPLAATDPYFWVLSPGPKTVVVTHKATQCKTTITTVLQDERTVPQVSVNVLSNETTCVPPNGSLIAVVAQGQPEDYGYIWFAGTSPSGPILSTDPALNQVPAGIYSVRIADNVSGCQATVSAVVQDQKPAVTVSVNVISNHITCGSPALPTGALQAVVNGQPWDYTFEWYEGASVSGPVVFMGPVISGLLPGVYTVVATHNASGCQAIVSAMVQEVFVPLVAAVEVMSENTSCTIPNGSLKAIILAGATAAECTYEWFEGSVYGMNPVLSVSDELHNVKGGVYSVVITRNNSMCMTIASQIVTGDQCQPGNMSSARSGATSLAASDAQLDYYPNPTTGTLWIKGETAAGYIVLSDRNGNVIRRQNLQPSAEPFAVDLAGQPAGEYVLTFTSGVRTSSYHIVKQ